jgi:quercetin dioxygenase-like cupin family protein
MKHVLYLVVCTVILSGSCCAQDESTVNVVQLVKTHSSWDGSDLPAYGKGRPEVTILRVTIPPGARLPLHKHPVINAAVVLSGDLTVVTEKGDTLHANSGKAFVEVVHQWHYGENDGNVPVDLVVFYAGLVDSPITVAH